MNAASASKSKNKKLILVDGHALFYRSYYAIPQLTTKDGFPTNALHGFLRGLFKVIKDERPDRLAVAFDGAEKTFRKKLSESYKAQRKPMPDDLVVQLEPLQRILKAMGIPFYIEEGYEADDVIATLARKAASGHAKMDVIIFSGDKDLYAMVNDEIKMLAPGRKVEEVSLLDREGVKQKMGVYPERIRDYLALTGDSSDNVSGIPGVGKKTALKILEEAGSVEALQKNTSLIKNEKLRKRVEDGLDQLKESLELVTLVTDVPVEYDWDDMAVKNYNTVEAQKLMKEYQLKSVREELDKNWSGPADDKEILTDEEKEKRERKEKDVEKRMLPHADYRSVLDQDTLKEMIEQLKHEKYFAIDTETTSERAMEAELVGISFAVDKGRAWYVPLRHTGPNAPEQLDLEETLEALRDLLEDEKIKKVGQNLKYDMVVLLNNDVHLAGIDFDTMLASYLIDPDRGEQNLDSLARDHLDHIMISFDEVVKDKKLSHIGEADVEKVTIYACEDADAAYRLTEILRKRIEKEKEINTFYHEVELPLLSVLAQMETAGFKLDVDFLEDYAKELDKEIKEVRKEIHKIAGEEFNIDSPKQLGAILFDKLDLPVIKKKKTGPSTDISVLTALSYHHELPARVIEYRELAKLQNTYVTALPKLVNKGTERVHTVFHQAVTVTGRLSSSDPNLQNIPIRSERGRRIRRAFTSERGNRLISADYSQIELRILAHMTGDKGLIEAFERGEDIHTRTAALIFDKKAEDVTKQERSKAKAVNFGISYGQSAHGLSQTLGISRKEAQGIIDSYFERFADVKGWMDRTIAEARQKRYVLTLWGRKRYLPEITSDNWNIRSFNERSAINTPIQGTAADLIKVAMIHVHERLKREIPEARLILQIHDELIVEAPKEKAEQAAAIVKHEMEHAADWKVPIVAEPAIGSNWLSAK